MNLKSRKFLVFVVNTVILAGALAAVFLLFDSPETLAKWILTAIIANGASYITGNIVVNGQKSKNYHPEMDK